MRVLSPLYCFSGERRVESINRLRFIIRCSMLDVRCSSVRTAEHRTFDIEHRMKDPEYRELLADLLQQMLVLLDERQLRRREDQLADLTLRPRLARLREGRDAADAGLAPQHA